VERSGKSVFILPKIKIIMTTSLKKYRITGIFFNRVRMRIPMTRAASVIRIKGRRFSIVSFMTFSVLLF
jgi:hypothetical protein